MQTNIFYSTGSGGWVVEFRQDGDKRWTRVGVYSDRKIALSVYNKLSARSAAERP